MNNDNKYNLTTKPYNFINVRSISRIRITEFRRYFKLCPEPTVSLLSVWFRKLFGIKIPWKPKTLYKVFEKPSVEIIYNGGTFRIYCNSYFEARKRYEELIKELEDKLDSL